MYVKVTIIVESIDDELVTALLTSIDTKKLNYPTANWLWEFITRDKRAANKNKLRLANAFAVQKRTKDMVIIGKSEINGNEKPRKTFNSALKWFEVNYESLKLNQMCLIMVTDSRDIKIYIQEDKAYVENN